MATTDVTGVAFSDIAIHCGASPVIVSVADAISLKRLGRLRFTNIESSSGKPWRITGSPGTIIDDVRLDQVSVATEAEEPLLLKHVHRLEMNRVSLTGGAAGAAYRLPDA